MHWWREHVKGVCGGSEVHSSHWWQLYGKYAKASHKWDGLKKVIQ